MKTLNEKYVPTFDEGDEVFVYIKERRCRATVIAIERTFIRIEDIDGIIRPVLAENCVRICEGCEGYSTLVYPACQRGGEIVDEVEETCRLCGGSGEEGGGDRDDYDPECIY